MRSARSVALGVLSMCGSVAAAVWIATSGVAAAETLSSDDRVELADEPTVQKKAVISKTRITVVERPKPVKKKRISFGTFEGY